MAQRSRITLSSLLTSLEVPANPSQESKGQLCLLALLFQSLPQKITTKMLSSQLLTPFSPDTRFKPMPYRWPYPRFNGRMRNFCRMIDVLDTFRIKLYLFFCFQWLHVMRPPS